jgi:hypothetical protein
MDYKYFICQRLLIKGMFIAFLRMNSLGGEPEFEISGRNNY